MSKIQLSLAGSQATVAAFVGWAGNSGASQGISYALGQLGFTLMADTYTAQWGNAISIGSGALPNATTVGALNGTAFPTVSNTARTALASSNFLGAWVSGTSYIAGNVVTSGSGSSALVYMCILAVSGSTAPGSDATHWTPYYMEVWEFTGGSGSLTPFYLKIEYGNSTTATTDPLMFIQVGTGYSTGASGFLTGNVSLAEQCFNGSGTIAATECDFAGDGSNYLAMNLFRGGAANPGPAIYAIERAISGTVSNAPVYNSAYVTYVKGYAAAGNWWQQSIFLSGTPVTAVRVNYANTMTLGAATASLIVNNTTPALPVFPLVGYSGNPMTVLIAQQEADSTEGTTQALTVYGASHNFIMTKTTFAQAFGGSGQTTSYAVGTRFD
jgi:hypothetical protein